MKSRLHFALGMIAALLIAALMISQSAQANDAAGSVAPELEGTWLVTVTIPDGPPPFASLATYARGGALTISDSSLSPALGNVYQGTWVRTGAREFGFTFLGFQYDAQGTSQTTSGRVRLFGSNAAATHTTA